MYVRHTVYNLNQAIKNATAHFPLVGFQVAMAAVKLETHLSELHVIHSGFHGCTPIAGGFISGTNPSRNG